MSAREWKPEDVAVIATRSSEAAVAVRDAVRGHWVTSDGYWRDDWVTEVRPVVVIDPESHRDTSRLCAVMRAQGWSGIGDDAPDDMRDVLREYAQTTHSRVDEPTGLGAVVEAIYDNQFVHIGGGLWQRVGDGTDKPCAFGEIAAVRVLSEGVIA